MNLIHEELLKTAQTEILSEKAQRYKRNVTLLGLVIAGAHILGAEFNGLNLFGVKLPKEINIKIASFMVLWLAHLYNSIMLWTYGNRDWQTWIENLTERWPEKQGDRHLIFPELKMYWGQLPQNETTRSIRLGSNIDRFKEWVEFKSDRHGQTFICIARLFSQHPNQGQQTSNQSIFEVPNVVVTTVKRQVKNFNNFDVWPVGLVVVFSLFGLFWDVSR